MKEYVVIAFGRGHTITCHGEHIAKPQNGFYVIEKACTVRVWGTEHGLGQLAAFGPIAGKTLLDAIPFRLKVPVDSVHMIFSCSDAASSRIDAACKEAEKTLLKSGK